MPDCRRPELSRVLVTRKPASFDPSRQDATVRSTQPVTALLEPASSPVPARSLLLASQRPAHLPTATRHWRQPFRALHRRVDVRVPHRAAVLLTVRLLSQKNAERDSAKQQTGFAELPAETRHRCCRTWSTEVVPFERLQRAERLAGRSSRMFDPNHCRP